VVSEQPGVISNRLYTRVTGYNVKNAIEFEMQGKDEQCIWPDIHVLQKKRKIDCTVCCFVKLCCSISNTN